MKDAQAVIAALGLEPLGFEGGYFKESYRSGETVDRTGSARAAATQIYYLLAPDSRSLMHRLQSDEVYHFYLGDPVELLTIGPDGAAEKVRLGPDIFAGERVQHVVRAGSWQGSRLVAGGRYALMGTTVSPGFELRDFELGRRSELLAAHPELEDWLVGLTPEVLETERLELAAATKDLLHAELGGQDALQAGLAARRDPTPEPWPPIGSRSPREDLAALERQAPDERGWGTWYVLRRSDRALIGRCALVGSPADHSFTLELAFLPSARGRGFAREAATALVEWAWRDPSVGTAHAELPVDDVRGREIAERLGMKLDSERGGLARYVMTREEATRVRARHSGK